MNQFRLIPRPVKTALAALFFLIAFSADLIAQTHHILQNHFLEIRIDLETGGIAQIRVLEDPDSSQVFNANDIVLNVTAGDLAPTMFGITENDSNSVTLRSNAYQIDTLQLNLCTIITYRLNENRLTVNYCFEPTEQMEFGDGLDINFSSSAWDTISIRNHFLGEDPVVLGSSTQPRYLGLNQLYELRSSDYTLRMVIPNPYHSFVTITPMEMQSFWFRWHVLVASDPFDSFDPLGPRLASVLPPGTKLYRRIELILTREEGASSITPGPIAYLSPFPCGWEQVIAMTFDNIPFAGFVIPKSGHDPDAPKQQYLLRLLEDHPRMRMGWVILPDAIWSEEDLQNPGYPAGKWWRAHSNSRLSATATPEYLQWLHNLENDSLVYGYEDRVHLGNHGFHHTPEMEFGANWEFQYHDPVVNDSTFAAIAEEYAMMGLTSKSLKWLRFPGFKFTRATVDALIENGFVFFDYWGIYNKLPWMMFHSEHGRIWGVGTQWEGDTPNSYYQMNSLFLSKGKLCHTAGHPHWWFDWSGDREAAYQQLHEIFQQAEADYPNLGYMFPDEAGDFADRTYDIFNFNSEMFSNSLVISFSGCAQPGQTIVTEWPESVPAAGGVTVDGQQVTGLETRGRRLFIELPALEGGLHTVYVPYAVGTSIREQSPPIYVTLLQNYPNPFNTTTTFSFSLTERTPATLSIYNLQGKRIRTLLNGTFDAGNTKAVWDGTDSGGNPVSSGVYFYRLHTGGQVLTRKMVLIH